MHTMMFHIERQPEACRRILDLEEATFQQVAGVLSAAPSRILVIATGSSLNATAMARPWFETVTGLPLDAVEPSTLVNYGARPGGYDLVLAVSQRGTSTSTIDAVEVARQRYGCPVIAVTGHPDSPLAGVVDGVVDIQCGPEDMPFSTVGVTATAVTLMLFALRLAEASNGPAPGAPGRSDLHETVDALVQVIEHGKNYVAERLPQLRQVSRWFLIGYGPGLGAVSEGELKVVETVRIPCTAHETEAFMHGPLFEVGQGYGVWFADTAGPGLERSVQLRDFVARYASEVVGATQADSQPDLLPLPHSHQLTASVLHLPPLQILAAQLSAARGVDLTTPAFPDFRKALKTKVRWDA